MTMHSSSDKQASVVYQSRGALLVCGEAEQIRCAVPLLPSGLKTLAVAPGGVAGVDGPSVQSVPGTVVEVKGHLGGFQVSAAGPEGPLDLGPLSPNSEGLFDLVLDLYESPLIDYEVPPLGYIRTCGNDEGLAERLKWFSYWSGTVNKPRYFQFKESICAHDRRGVAGCRRCLDACPAGAIRSDSSSIVINPYLCQGCGTCSVTCPTGAVSYARPQPRSTLNVIAETLDSRAVMDSAWAPVIVLHAGKERPNIPDQVPAVQLETVASVGMEVWFSALALGASTVLVLRSGMLPDTADELLVQQVDLARDLLHALGEAPERIRLLDDTADVEWGGLPNPWPAVSLSKLRGPTTKRGRLLAALEHLATHLQPLEEAPTLQVGAPFGAVEIHEERCTLCHACVNLCPTGALRNSEGGLSFAEPACVQCGLCVNGCPEQALELAPRLDLAALLGGERELKPASEMFCCEECGTPFARRSLVEGSMAHVLQHPMFQGEDGTRLLRMCMSCRQKASLELPG